MGVAPGANIGENAAMFEAVHGSAPDIAGKGIANPTSLLLSGCMMLEHLGDMETSARIRAAVDTVVRGGEIRTVDMGGDASTRDFTRAVVKALF